MSAIDSLKTYSDEALNGAIRQLEFNRAWSTRLSQLLAEKNRRLRNKRNPSSKS